MTTGVTLRKDVYRIFRKYRHLCIEGLGSCREHWLKGSLSVIDLPIDGRVMLGRKQYYLSCWLKSAPSSPLFLVVCLCCLTKWGGSYFCKEFYAASFLCALHATQNLHGKKYTNLLGQGTNHPRLPFLVNVP